MTDVNEDYTFVEEVLGKEYAEIVRNRYHAVRDVEAYNEPVDIKSQGGGVLAERLCENEIIFSCRKRNI